MNGPTLPFPYATSFVELLKIIGLKQNSQQERCESLWDLGHGGSLGHLGEYLMQGDEEE